MVHIQLMFNSVIDPLKGFIHTLTVGMEYCNIGMGVFVMNCVALMDLLIVD